MGGQLEPIPVVVEQRQPPEDLPRFNLTPPSSSLPHLLPHSITAPPGLHCYMVPDLSPASPAVVLPLVKILSVGVRAGLPTPDEPELLERC